MVTNRQLLKTAAFYHQCQKLFNKYYVPGSELAVDETMIRFQGRSKWVTVIRSKPVPVGFKLFTVAADGYLLGFRIFRGKGGYRTKQSVLHHVVVDLVQHWTGVNRTVYFDNLYTSPALCEHLLRLHTRSCGTCRANRHGLPPYIKRVKKRLEKGETRSWQRGQLGCLIWNDSKPVIFLSTHRRVDRLTHIPATSWRAAMTRPTVAVDYNFNKGHIDQVDQLRSYYVCSGVDGARGLRLRGGYSICALATPTSCGVWTPTASLDCYTSASSYCCR